MKFLLVFMIFVAPGKVNYAILPFAGKALEKAFVNVLEALANRNHLTSIVTMCNFDHNMHLASFAFAAGIPHVTVRFDNESTNFTIKSRLHLTRLLHWTNLTKAWSCLIIS